jgi:anaerobic magnesium-protoporphyrin IX monomethyl ester cyclase
MQVALIQPDSPYLTYPLAFPNLGLLYISAYLKKNGVKTDFYDLTGGIEMPLIKADIIAFSCQITQFKEVCRIKDKLKRFNPHATFVIGGPFPTFSYEECSKEGFYVIRGEGEEPMLQLAKGEDKSYGFVDPNYFPDWDAIDLSRYGYGLEGKRCMNIMTKRGNCPYRCTFCAKSELKSQLRFRSPENVLEECRILRDDYGFGAIAIYDDDVLLDRRRDYEIFKGLKKLGMPYRCMTRSNLANYEDLKVLKETGCAEVAVGVESADPFIHNTVCRKGTTIKQDTEFVNNCKKLGLRVKTYLIIGLPSESRQTVELTRKWLEKNQPDNYDVSIFTPYPGSDIYTHKKEYDIDWDEDELKEIWYSGEAQYGKCAVRTSHLTSKEILALKKELEAKRGESGTTDYWKPL